MTTPTPTPYHLRPLPRPPICRACCLFEKRAGQFAHHACNGCGRLWCSYHKHWWSHWCDFGAGENARMKGTTTMEPTCCQPDCGKPAEFEVQSEADGKRPDYDRTTQACAAHVGALCEPGTSTVWPLAATR